MTGTAQGLRAWLLQRATAVYLAVYLVVVPVALAMRWPMDFLQWRSFFAAPVTNVATSLFALALLLHVWVGVRDVLIDYVHAVWLRLTLMALTGLVLLGCLLSVLRVLAVTAAAIYE
jgi:succinate dehydrogenase / fumarate reductase membrane anchor subunit